MKLLALLSALPVAFGLPSAVAPPAGPAPPPKALDKNSDPVKAREQSRASRVEADACWAALKGARGMAHVLCALRETTAVAEAQLAGLGIEPNRWWRNMGHVSGRNIHVASGVRVS